MEVLEGQVCVFDIIEDVKKETLQEKMKKQLYKAIKKGIVPGAKIIFDNDRTEVWEIWYIHMLSGGVLGIYINSRNCSMSWEALSSRIKVIE
ncbi:hypothetical protein VOI00_001848 [Clostridium perfringens]